MVSYALILVVGMVVLPPASVQRSLRLPVKLKRKLSKGSGLLLLLLTASDESAIYILKQKEK
jgi:hypothetical protein